MGYNRQKIKMKRILFVVSMMLLFSMVSFAQIQLLHRFPKRVTSSFPEVSIPDNIESNRYYYRSYIDNDQLDYVDYYYNADFSLERMDTLSKRFALESVPAELQSQGWSYESSYSLSTNLINTDSDEEFLVYLEKYYDYDYYYYGYIINKQGQILGNLGYSSNYFSSDNISFHNVNGQIRMQVRKYYYYDENSTMETYFDEIYACGGICTQVIENQNNKIAPEAYPNPAREIINIPYELNEGEISTIRIYDINGKMIEQKSVGYHFNSIELNVSNYKSGTYIYECNGNSGKFIVQ